MAAPNTQLQRTRAARSPLSRKPLGHRAKSTGGITAFVLAIIGSASCTFNSVTTNEPVPAWQDARAQFAGMHVEVSPLESPEPYVVERREPAVADLVEDLRRTGLFDEVFRSDGVRKGNVRVLVSSAGGASKCGTPAFFSALTLGLVPGSTAYFHSYDFRFVSLSGNREVKIEKQITGEVRSGLVALPLRLSRDWSPPRSRGAPASVLAILRAEIVRHSDEIRALLRETSASNVHVP